MCGQMMLIQGNSITDDHGVNKRSVKINEMCKLI